jgi:hypothetical protein
MYCLVQVVVRVIIFHYGSLTFSVNPCGGIRAHLFLGSFLLVAFFFKENEWTKRPIISDTSVHSAAQMVEVKKVK